MKKEFFRSMTDHLKSLNMNAKFLSLITIFIFFNLDFNAALFGQCYENIRELSGIDISDYQSDLETAACNLKTFFPNEYRDGFKVFDIGYYLHDPLKEGGENILSGIVSEITSETPYYLLFAKESSSSGIYSKIHVELNLPDEGVMSCAQGAKLDGLKNELQRIMEGIDFTYEYANKEVEAMTRLGQYIEQAINCCNTQKSRNKSSILLDSALLTINLCIDNSCQNDPPGSVALITNLPSMPQIAFKLSYPSPLCTFIKAELEVQYQRGNRTDSHMLTLENVEMEYEYVFDMNDFYHGGRAVIRFLDDVGSELKSIEFTIKGLNPEARDVFDYMDDQGYTNRYWFMKKMAAHESGSHIRNLGMDLLQFNRHVQQREDLAMNWDNYSRCPNMSFDFGWGIFQHTNPAPSSEALWNWKENVDDAYDILENKIRTVVGKCETDVELVNEWNDDINNINNQVDRIDRIHGGITWKMASNVSITNTTITGYFTDALSGDERSFLDACLMLAYNGFGGNKVNGIFRNFVYARNNGWTTDNTEKPYWVVLDNQQTYVKKVSETTVPIR